MDPTVAIILSFLGGAAAMYVASVLFPVIDKVAIQKVASLEQKITSLEHYVFPDHTAATVAHTAALKAHTEAIKPTVQPVADQKPA